MTKVGEIIQQIERFAPNHLAEDWDPIGLAIGSKNKRVKRMMVALDLDANTLKEAKEKEIDFLFTHHPPIFSSLTTLNEEDARRREYIDLIRSNISLYAAHTNIDAAEDGMNDWLAETLGLEKPYETITHSYTSNYKLLALYTPLEHSAQMREVLHQAGAGTVGDYSNVSYNSMGIGRFTPSEAASPTIGQALEAEQVSEERTEILVPNHLIDEVIQVIYKEHPYEEPVFHLIDVGKKEKEYGIGRVGDLEDSLSIEEVISHLKSQLDVPNVRVANVDLSQEVKRIAILGGSGEKYYKEALSKGADLYITGDISYHGAQDMIREGLPFIDPGHFIEKIFVEKMTDKLAEWNEELHWEIEVIPSISQRDVFKFK